MEKIVVITYIVKAKDDAAKIEDVDEDELHTEVVIFKISLEQLKEQFSRENGNEVWCKIFQIS